MQACFKDSVGSPVPGAETGASVVETLVRFVLEAMLGMSEEASVDVPALGEMLA